MATRHVRNTHHSETDTDYNQYSSGGGCKFFRLGPAHRATIQLYALDHFVDIDKMVTLSAATDDELLHAIHSGEWSDEQLAYAIYQHNYSELLPMVQRGYNKQFFDTDWSITDNALINSLNNNIYSFSAAKSFAQTTALRDAVYNERGELVPWREYKTIAQGIVGTYEGTWLETERQQVIMASTQASRYVDQLENADLEPYLEYVTARDEHVRRSHQDLDGIVLPINDPFWKQYYPPNGWRCRCFTRGLSEREAEHAIRQWESRRGRKMPTSGEAMRMAGLDVAKPFRFNPGFAKIVFNEDQHPYFQAVPGNKPRQLSAVKNYALPSVRDIYSNPNNLHSHRATFESTDEYSRFWQQQEAEHGVVGDGFTLVDKKLNISAHFDNDLRKKMIERGRYNYFGEAIDTFNKPDEVWGIYKGGKRQNSAAEAFNLFLRYYEGAPTVLLINLEGRVDSFYRYSKDLGDFEAFREGLLKLKR